MKLTIEKTDGTKLTFEGEALEIERIAKEFVQPQTTIRFVPYIVQPVIPPIGTSPAPSFGGAPWSPYWGPNYTWSLQNN